MRIPLYVVLGCYLLGIFAVSLVATRRVTDETDYLVAGRRLPLWLAWATLLATWFGAATLLGAAEAARVEGVRGTVLDPFASGAALIVAGLFFAKPLWEMRLLTFADFYGRTFGPRAEIAASVILVPGYFGWIAAQYLALAALQQTFFGITPATGILVAAAVVLAYTLIGGMWSVTLTDALQMAVILATLAVLAIATLSQLGAGSPTGGLARLFSETPRDFLTLFPEAGVAAGLAWLATWGNGVLGNIPGPDLMQRVFASRDALTARRACVLAGVVYIGFGLLPVGLGLASRLLIPDGGSGDVLSVLAGQYVSPLLTTVFAVSLVSVIVSTCTSAVLAPASILGHNLLARLSPFRGRALFTDRLAVLLITGAGIATAFSGGTILDLLELSLSVGLAGLFVPMVGGLIDGDRTERAAMLAMAFGIAVWFVRETMEWVFLPLPEAAAEQGLAYADYVRTVFSPAQSGGAASRGVWLFALIPSAFSGTAASCLGYVVGRWSGPVRTARGLG